MHLDVEQTKRITSVRIHVERVIGNVRNKYKILQRMEKTGNSDVSGVKKSRDEF